jgi:hypothetical protein
MSGWQRRKLKSRNMSREPQVEEKEVGRGFMVLLMGFNGVFSGIYITDKYVCLMGFNRNYTWRSWFITPTTVVYGEYKL